MKFKIIGSIIIVAGLIFNFTVFGVLETELGKLNGNLTTLNQSLIPKEERTITLTFPFTDSIVDYVLYNAPTDASIKPLSDAIENLIEHADLRLNLAAFDLPSSINLDSFRNLLEQQKNFAPHFIKIKDIKLQNNDIIAEIEYLDLNRNPITKNTLVTSLESNNKLNKYFNASQQPMNFLPQTVILKNFNNPQEAQDYFDKIDNSLKKLLITQPSEPPVEIEIKKFSFIASDDKGTSSYIITL